MAALPYRNTSRSLPAIFPNHLLCDIGAAQWWAQLDDRQRDVLSEKNPDALTPAGLQDRCRETHPDWAKSRKSVRSRSAGTVKKQGKTTSALPATTRKKIEAAVYLEEVKAKREQRAAAAAEAAANDQPHE